MATALRIAQGGFGRVALLDTDCPLVLHAHPHCHVLIKAQGADTQFLVGERMQPLTDRTAVLVNAWEPHAYAHSANAPRTLILALYIEPRWLDAVQKGWMASASPGFFSRPCVEITSQIRAIADELGFELLHNPDEGERHQALLFKLMLAVIERFSEWRVLRGLRSISAQPVADFRIRRVIGIMKEAAGEAISVDRLAREAGLSRAHFFKLFEQATRLTPHTYLNVLRMERAIQEISCGRALASISDELGFSAQSHFTRFFRNHLGITPSEYRRAAIDLAAA